MNNEKIIVAVETGFHVPKMNWYRRWKLKRANKRRLKNLKKHGIISLESIGLKSLCREEE